MKIAAIYARVSGDRQREEQTIASQTAALIEFAGDHGYSVPDEWIIEDDGFSGAELIRPGLERIRDLAAEGAIQTVLVHSPDRLCREYVHQVLLIEEFSRAGVDVLFIKSPKAETPEDRLLLQFQGMFAEYERTQILERSRRGKLHRARQGQINVLGGAPYGYLYVRKSDAGSARYEVVEAEAAVVRAVYAWYTVDGLSIGAITRRLTEQGVPTRKQRPRWERSTVWAMLRNPAYKGLACFGKTQLAPRQRVTRPLRQRGGFASRNSASHEQPKTHWIEIPVPAIVSEETFAVAEELLERNKHTSPRRTVEPTLLQGMVSCRKCGYALYRTSTRSTARKINYYRCLGADRYRHLPGPPCDNRPIRQDLLDSLVWAEVLRLLEDPALIQREIDRRLDMARTHSPTKRREAELERQLVHARKSMDRLLTAYQEDLLSLDDLRCRMPDLRQREQTLRSELQTLQDRNADEAAVLQLTQTLASFLLRLRETAETLDIHQRQKILRLLVREVLVDEDSITIRHSIQIPRDPDEPSADRNSTLGRLSVKAPSYLLRSGCRITAARQRLPALRLRPVGQPLATAGGNRRHDHRALRRRYRGRLRARGGRLALLGGHARAVTGVRVVAAPGQDP
ncbi:MAG: invertase, partial [Thermomicrobiales bacterium]|nr:invertase [Thermomicrobiales bacterium]